EARIGQGLGDRKALLSCLDRARVIAGEEEPMSPVDRCPSESGPIADAPRLRLRFAQMPQHAAVIEQGYARLTQGESEIDPALEGGGRGGGVAERVERLLEARHRLSMR